MKEVGLAKNGKGEKKGMFVKKKKKRGGVNGGEGSRKMTMANKRKCNMCAYIFI